MARIYGSYKIIGTIRGRRHYKINDSEVIYVAENGGANGALL